MLVAPPVSLPRRKGPHASPLLSLGTAREVTLGYRVRTLAPITRTLVDFASSLADF